MCTNVDKHGTVQPNQKSPFAKDPNTTQCYVTNAFPRLLRCVCVCVCPQHSGHSNTQYFYTPEGELTSLWRADNVSVSVYIHSTCMDLDSWTFCTAHSCGHILYTVQHLLLGDY